MLKEKKNTFVKIEYKIEKKKKTVCRDTPVSWYRGNRCRYMYIVSGEASARGG